MIELRQEAFLNLPTVNFRESIIDQSAVWAIQPEQSYQFNILPFAWEAGQLCVAIAEPVYDSLETLFESLPSAHLFRIGHSDLLEAQRKSYGIIGQPHQYFGEVAMARGLLTSGELDVALRTQAQEGGKIGQICVSKNFLNAWNVAEILHATTKVAAVNLLKSEEQRSQSTDLESVWNVFDEEFWRRNRMVPLTISLNEVTVAKEDPFSSEGQIELSEKLGMRVRVLITGRRDIESVLNERTMKEDLRASRDRLFDQNPGDSAKSTVTRAQMTTFSLLVVFLIGLIAWHPIVSLAILSSILIALYTLLVGYRLWIIRDGVRVPSGISVGEKQLVELNNSDLPIYTILVPAREEATVLPQLTQSLIDLDYPKDRLDVKLILEEDDIETINAARRAHLPNFIEIVIVPAEEPRTKPKACNFALQRARGEFVTIFDAEDSPEPSQLKKALIAFRQADDDMVCLQAKLSYFNSTQNLLTKWFTAEYAAWFDLFLPSLHSAKLPIPLGGTSNHFRTAVLRKIGAWDPYNVTEDADLGIRIFKAGYRTSIIDAVTYEEANSDFVNWVRQRSRWIKGYMQTWLVHMRHPRTLYEQLGPRGFWGFQMSILATPLMFLLNPVYWFLTTLWFLTYWHVIPFLFPPGIYYLGMLNLLAGNFAFTYINAIGTAKRGNWSLVPYTLFSPVYWAMMSLASWKALIQLITRPSHWEKTEHGLVNWKKIAVEHPISRNYAD